VENQSIQREKASKGGKVEQPSGPMIPEILPLNQLPIGIQDFNVVHDRDVVARSEPDYLLPKGLHWKFPPHKTIAFHD